VGLLVRVKYGRDFVGPTAITVAMKVLHENTPIRAPHYSHTHTHARAQSIYYSFQEQTKSFLCSVAHYSGNARRKEGKKKKKYSTAYSIDNFNVYGPT
jgi:hypothetical protein